MDDEAAGRSAARAGRRAGAFKVLARQSLALAITFLTFSTDILPKMKMRLSTVKLLRSLGNLATLVARALQLVGGRLTGAIAARYGRGAVRRTTGDLV